jgi:hypothetical protein
MPLGAGGVVLPAGVWWQVQWPAEVTARFRAMERGEAAVGTTVTIAHLELAALILGLGVMAAVSGEVDGKAVLALADNTNAVAWVGRAGARDVRAAALMRVLGVEEAAGRWSLLAEHLPGVDNGVADFLSRHAVAEARAYMETVPSAHADGRAWRQVPVPASWWTRVCELLLTTTPATR